MREPADRIKRVPFIQFELARNHFINNVLFNQRIIFWPVNFTRYRSQAPVELFSLDGRPELARVCVEATDVSAYQSLLMEDR